MFQIKCTNLGNGYFYVIFLKTEVKTEGNITQSDSPHQWTAGGIFIDANLSYPHIWSCHFHLIPLQDPINDTLFGKRAGSHCTPWETRGRAALTQGETWSSRDTESGQTFLLTPRIQQEDQASQLEVTRQSPRTGCVHQSQGDRASGEAQALRCWER